MRDLNSKSSIRMRESLLSVRECIGDIVNPLQKFIRAASSRCSRWDTKICNCVNLLIKTS